MISVSNPKRHPQLQQVLDFTDALLGENIENKGLRTCSPVQTRWLIPPFLHFSRSPPFPQPRSNTDKSLLPASRVLSKISPVNQWRKKKKILMYVKGMSHSINKNLRVVYWISITD